MLFAVAYQNLSTHKGFITCWNVQNINYPELVISTSTNPTTVKFSVENPRLLATGDESGMVRFLSLSTSSVHCPENRVLSMYQTRKSFKFFQVYRAVRLMYHLAFVSGSGHKGSVLDLCWIGSKVMSSGSDGRVLMWTTVSTDLTLECQGKNSFMQIAHRDNWTAIVELNS